MGKKFNLKKEEFINTNTKLFNLDTQYIFNFDKSYKFNDIFPAISPRDVFHHWIIFGNEDIYLGFIPWESSTIFPMRFNANDNNSVKNNFNELLNQKSNSERINFEYLDVEVFPIILIDEK